MLRTILDVWMFCPLIEPIGDDNIFGDLLLIFHEDRTNTSVDIELGVEWESNFDLIVMLLNSEHYNIIVEVESKHLSEVELYHKKHRVYSRIDRPRWNTVSAQH